MYFCNNFVELRLFWRTLSVLLIFDMLVVVFWKDFGIQCQEIKEENGLDLAKNNLDLRNFKDSSLEKLNKNKNLASSHGINSKNKNLYKKNFLSEELNFFEEKNRQINTDNLKKQKNGHSLKRSIELIRHKEQIKEEIGNSGFEKEQKARKEKHNHELDINATVPDRPYNKEKDDMAPSIKGKQHQHIHRLQQISVNTAGVHSVFATENNTVVMAQIGGTATLPCVVRKFNTGVISWIRKLDYHLLTVGLTTYNADGRFLVEHIRHLQNWGLLIKHVQPSDEGLYECQVSTHPPTSIFVELKVTEASAEITGAPDLHLRAGSTLRLLCTLRQSTEAPAYVFWYHEHRMINYDHGVNVSRTSGGAGSNLILPEADKTHNGNYTCSPSNAIPASINVHVINATAEEQPAAMQHANTSATSGVSSLYLAKYCNVINWMIVLVILKILVVIINVEKYADRKVFVKTEQKCALNNRRDFFLENEVMKNFCGQIKT